MIYYAAQIIGILVTVGVVLSLQMKKKWQILTVSAACNILSAVNIFLLDGFNSAVLVNLLACVQIALSTWHDSKGEQIPLFEKILILVLYVLGGLLGYKQPLDLLAVMAVIFYMISVFQKKEQRVRLFLLCNMTTWAVYHLILGSTAFFGQIAGILSSVIALIRYKRSSDGT